MDTVEYYNTKTTVDYWWSTTRKLSRQIVGGGWQYLKAINPKNKRHFVCSSMTKKNALDNYCIHWNEFPCCKNRWQQVRNSLYSQRNYAICFNQYGLCFGLCVFVLSQFQEFVQSRQNYVIICEFFVFGNYNL